MRKDLLLLTGGRLAQAFLAIASLRLVTALLSPAQVGSMFLILSLASCVGLFFISPVGLFINRRLHGWHDRKVLWKRFRLYNLYVLAVSALALPVILSGKVFLGLGSDIPLFHFMAAVALYLCFSTWSQNVVQALNMLGRRGAFVALSVLSTALGLVFSVCLVLLAGKTAYAWLYGQVLSFLVVYIPARHYIKALEPVPAGGESTGFGTLKAAALAPLWQYTAPLAVATLFMWVQTQSYRVIVEKFAGPEFLGYLAIGLSIATSLAGVTESLVHQFYYPAFYEKISGADQAGRAAALSDLARKTIPVYIILALFTVFMSRHLTRLLVAPQFQAAWTFAAIGALIELFRMITNIFCAAAHSEMKTSALVWPYFWGGLVTCAAVLAACLPGAPRLLIPACMAVGGGLTMLLARRRMKELAVFRIDGAAVLKSLLLCAGFVPAFLFARQEPLWRALAIVAVFGTYFLFVQWRIMFPDRGFPGLNYLRGGGGGTEGASRGENTL